MTNPIIKIVNTQTGEEIERPMTADEFDEYNAARKADSEIVKAKEQRLAAKSELLKRLGITEEEAALLLG